MRRRETRADAVKYTTPKDAHRQLIGQQEGAEAARLRMLQRMGLNQEVGPAADARERMIQRRERRVQ